MALPFFQSLLQHSDAGGSRSTVLKSLTWFLALLFALLGTILSLKAETYIIIFVMVLISLTSLLFLFAFAYCLFIDRDALRSESYSIKKLQIEKGIIGDDTTGVINKHQVEVVEIGTINTESEEGSRI